MLHVHETASLVIGGIEERLVILAQSGCRLCNEVGYHGFEGLAQDEDEVPRMLADLGDKHTLIMLNHGLLSIGASLGEAFGYMRALIDACALQERVMATHGTMRPIPEALQAHTKAQMSGNRGNAPREDISWAYWLRLAELSIELERTPASALFLAGQAFGRYRAAGGPRTSVLPDFFIGAHAQVMSVPILTRDVRRYRSYFPEVRLIAPAA